MSINTPEELASMRAAGEVVRRMLDAMKEAVRPELLRLSWMKSAAKSCTSMEPSQPLNWCTSFRA